MMKEDSMNSSLAEMKVGESARVAGFDRGQEGKAYRNRLLAMGLTPGTEFTVTRLAPMGDPIEIRVRGFALSLRKAEAAALRIERIN